MYCRLQTINNTFGLLFYACLHQSTSDEFLPFNRIIHHLIKPYIILRTTCAEH